MRGEFLSCIKFVNESFVKLTLTVNKDSIIKNETFTKIRLVQVPAGWVHPA